MFGILVFFSYTFSVFQFRAINFQIKFEENRMKSICAQIELIILLMTCPFCPLSTENLPRSEISFKLSNIYVIQGI